MQQFLASEVNTSEMAELNAFVLIFSETQDGSGRHLEIQKALSFDEQDRRLGHDTYCLRTETGATCYGGVSSWSVQGDFVTLLLDDHAAAELGVRRGFRVSFDVALSGTVRASLARLLGDAA